MPSCTIARPMCSLIGKMRPPLYAVLTRLLEKSPGARFQSTADLIAALEDPGVANHDVKRSTPRGRSRTTWVRARYLASRSWAPESVGGRGLNP